MSIDRTEIDALVATVARTGSDIDAGRSIIPRSPAGRIRARIDAMRAHAAGSRSAARWAPADAT